MAEIIPNPADLIQAILDELVAEINDPRTLPQERTGIRVAHVIVRRVAERMGVGTDVAPADTPNPTSRGCGHTIRMPDEVALDKAQTALTAAKQAMEGGDGH